MALPDNVDGGISGLLDHNPSFDPFAVLLGEAQCGKQERVGQALQNLDQGKRLSPLVVSYPALPPGGLGN